MISFRELIVRVVATLHPGRPDGDIEDELRSHLELAREAEERHGVNGARSAALRSGGLAASVDAMRDQRSLPFLEDFVRDVRHALRTIGRNGAFSAVVLVTIAIGIGATTAVFAVVNRDRSMARTSFTLVLVTLAAGMALALGLIGIYGVIAYSVSQRRREIGIRLALGAQATELTRMFLRRGLALTAFGLPIGIALSVVVARLMSSLLFGVSPLDPATYCCVPLVLVTAAGVASYLPARRAAAVDPGDVLRLE